MIHRSEMLLSCLRDFKIFSSLYSCIKEHNFLFVVLGAQLEGKVALGSYLAKTLDDMISSYPLTFSLAYTPLKSLLCQIVSFSPSHGSVGPVSHSGGPWRGCPTCHSQRHLRPPCRWGHLKAGGKDT